LNAIQNVGQLASLPFCAFACDHFGRKKTLVFGACIILLGTGLQGGAQNSKLRSPSAKYLHRLADLRRWHVHRGARNYWIRAGIQYYCRTHFDYGARVSDSEGSNGEHIQLALESGSHCGCMDNLWDLSDHEQLGLEDSVYTPSTFQHCPDSLFLVDR
jgi:hypothetical protein